MTYPVSFVLRQPIHLSVRPWQAVRLNADLAYAEGKESELSIGGAIGEVLPSMGREAVVVAAERTVEIEVERLQDQPGELLR